MFRLRKRPRTKQAPMTQAEANQFGQLGILPFTRHPIQPDYERLPRKGEVAIWIDNSEPKSCYYVPGRDNG